MSVTDAVEWVRDVGVLGVLVLTIIAWIRGWVHSHREFRAMELERDWWRSTAMRALALGEAAVSRRPDEQEQP